MLTVEFIDRAPTVRFYDHTGHMSAAVCCETSLHALTDGRRHDHREGCEDAISRGREGVKHDKLSVCLSVKGRGALLGPARTVVAPSV